VEADGRTPPAKVRQGPSPIRRGLRGSVELGVRAMAELTRAVRLQMNPTGLETPVRSGSAESFTTEGEGVGLVVTLSSIPSRIEGIAPALRSLLDQTIPPDEIVLALPDWSLRENRGYDLPPWIAEHPRIRVLRAKKDWGPATKLIPTLRDYADQPETALLAVDDDNIYPRTFVETFLRWGNALPEAALTLRGCAVPESRRWRDCVEYKGSSIQEPTRTDIVEGCAGILVRPSFFDARFFDYESAPPEAFFVDDLWISGHLARGRVPAHVIPFEGAFVYVPVVASLHGARLDRGENRSGDNNDVMLDYFDSDWGWG